MKRKIIIVDDNPNITSTIKMAIEESKTEYEAITANSGEQCIEILKEINPDAILLDLMMPGMSGWETYEVIKQNEEWVNVPILFLTARTDDFTKRSCTFLGDDYIEKPFELSDLINRIEQAIERANQ